LAKIDPLILIPGILCDAALWRHQQEAFSPRTLVQVADITRDDRVAAMASRILREAPPRFALAGLSMGGIVAQEIMRQAPDRVSRLALISTSARADTPEQKATNLAQVQNAAKLPEDQFKGATGRMLQKLVHPARLTDSSLVDEVLSMTIRVGRDAYLRQQTASAWRVDGRESLRAIRVKTLVLCGREDAMTPLKLHHEMAERIPGSELRIIEDCGHLATMERPEAVNAVLLDWLMSAEAA